MTINDIISNLKNVRGSNGQYTALCPAHDDKTNSLSVKGVEGGKILLHCHAGCTVESIAVTMGIKMADLFPNSISGTPKKTQSTSNVPPEAEYLYYDLDGNVVHKTIRYGKQYKKPFSQARPNPVKLGKWIYNLKDTKTIIYKLPQVHEAIAGKKPIFIVEGEKDADNMERLGFTATTSPMGAGKWKDYYSDYLVNAICYIIPDNDKQGKAYVKQISHSLVNKAAVIKILDLTVVHPKLKEKGDITDFFHDLGKDKGLKLLNQLIESSPEYKPDLNISQVKQVNDELAELFKDTPYFVQDGRLWRSGTDDDKLLADFVPIPTATLTKDDGVNKENFFKLKAKTSTGKTLQEITIPAEKLNSMQWIAPAWGFEANYAPGTMVKDYIRHAIMSVGSRHAVIETIYTHTGFRNISDKWIYLYNGGAIGMNNVSVELEGNLSNFKFPAHADDYTEAVKEDFNFIDVAPKRITLPLLSMAYISPLNEFLRQAKCEPAYILFLLGVTGVRKSTLAALNLCHFGTFTEKTPPGSFKDTANALEKKGFLLKDCLTVIDDYHPTLQKSQAAKMESTAQEISRAYGDRTGRDRMNSDTSLKGAYVPRGNLIISGEDIPNIGQSGMARNLFIEVKAGDIDMERLTQLQKNREMLNLAMRGYIEWLIPQIDGLPHKLGNMFNKYRSESQKDKQHGRMAEMVAWLQIGYEMFLEYATTLGLVSDVQTSVMKTESFDIFSKLADEQNSRIENDQPTVKFVNALRELLATNVCHVLDIPRDYSLDFAKNDGFIGYNDKDYYYLYSDTTYKKIVEFYNQQGINFPVSKDALFKQLDYEGSILTEERNGRIYRVKSKRIAGKLERYVWLKKSAVVVKEDINLKRGIL